ncbi:glycogen debranching protein GlgX [Rhizobium sp. SSA_523]|uniref:glycogen debranching protein GlgX n=1 Tax=Rhizobium sp. SSA_523 TaxID=2952477 RepID=UPI002091778F|nr:glycogen debranching protein GlgX [Rhizobium sp. SSA_523]MCO5731857.1 glycogen debranching protein GlgX [Rhizobium sp. SSA_523]WKC22782.1 glycogen debranching protein GlgX [Rhizobium sp. SSA_523]
MTNSPLGAVLLDQAVRFSIMSQHAEAIELCLFEADGAHERARLFLQKTGDGLFSLDVPDLAEGTRYGLRAHGPYDPDRGLWFDPSKLLVDPYAKQLDRPFRHDSRLSLRGKDTAPLVPKAIVTRDHPVALESPRLPQGGFIYELNVRAFTMQHPDVPPSERGTLAALAHPSVLAHLKRIGVDAVELMPITAWIDERHLPGLGLTNGWGYNPVAFMALDPRLVPGGMDELAKTVRVLHEHGIGVILDLVFNHTGESDRHGATLSLRGLDNLTYYRHVPGEPGHLINDTGTGNTIACDEPVVRQLILDTLRHFVLHGGVDGFRFDLGTVLGRSAHGFSRDSETLGAILSDRILSDRVLIAEPWDIGPGGYQLGNFPPPFLEWNDRTRDDLRCFWRGDAWKAGRLAHALAGSSDAFMRHGQAETRTVNFLCAHDGFTLMDLVSYAHKHNEANGEENRDGHNENHSWNNGIEGESDDPAVVAARFKDVKALLATLFASRGTIMLTAGDEGGRSQHGNNNAYAQDNPLTWLDWTTLDDELVQHTASLASLRRRFSAFSDLTFFSGRDGDVEWLNRYGAPMTVAEWEEADRGDLTMVLKTHDRKTQRDTRLAVVFNRHRAALDVSLPGQWQDLESGKTGSLFRLPPRSVLWCVQASGLEHFR